MDTGGKLYMKAVTNLLQVDLGTTEELQKNTLNCGPPFKLGNSCTDQYFREHILKSSSRIHSPLLGIKSTMEGCRTGPLTIA
jgi:hypothetical protein